MKQMLRVGVVALGLFACERSRTADGRHDTSASNDATHVVMNAADLKWGPAPPGLPAGGQAAVLDGDPGKSGVFVVRMKAPDGYTIMPHTHPTAERLTILSGTFKVGMGEKFDESTMHTMTTGAYVSLPAGHAHYAKCSGETIIQITSDGPFQINYIDPKDDPRRTAGGSGNTGLAAPQR